jgi:hypothetical protein
VPRLVLLEHTPQGFLPTPDDVVVALTPEACYELDRQDVDYDLPTDFGVDARIAALEPLHWREQLDWMNTLDEIVTAHVPRTEGWRFGAATLYGYGLKTLVDPVRVRALELDCMLDSFSRVILHRRVEGDPSLTSLVLPLIAAARGIACEEQTDEAAARRGIPAAPLGTPDAARPLKLLQARLHRGLRTLRRLRLVLGRRRTRPLTLLFADGGYDLTYLLARAREEGHRCLRVEGDTVVEEGRHQREIVRLPVEEADGSWDLAAEAIARAEHPLWNWPNGWFPGVTLGDVLRPRILYWLREVMPVVAARAAALDELIRHEHVDFVLGANIANRDVVAAAAVTARPTQSALVDHGHAAHASELFDLIMLRHVDHNFCATDELARYMETRRALYDYPTAEIHVGSYQWRANAARTRPRQPPQPVPDDRPVVVYALGATGGSGRYLNSPWFTDGWYYGLCREIVDVLARHPEVFSVVKLFPRDGVIRNPIDLYVGDLGLDHVVSSRAPLRAWIPWADRMVFDYPSTGLYEAAAAGVPYFALLYTRHPYRPTAVDQLGTAAAYFTEAAEAACAVEAFVAAPTVSAPRLAPEGEEILTALERIAGAEG